MAIIYSYPTESPSPKDLILGMQTANDKKTVVFTIESLTGSLSDSIINNNLPASFSTISSSGGITGNLDGNTDGIHSGSLDSAVTGTTQPLGTDNTTLATTAFVQLSGSVGPFELGASSSILARDGNTTEVGTTAYSLAFGKDNSLGASYSTVGGYLNSVTGSYSTVLGRENIGSGSYSSTLGRRNEAAGETSGVLTGEDSVALGNRSTVLSGDGAIAAGSGSLVAGQYASAFSSGGVALGNGTSTAISTKTGVGASGSIAVGVNTLASGTGAFATGASNTEPTFTIIQAGDGFTVKDDTLQSVTDSTNTVTIQVKILINSSGVPTSVRPLDFPTGFATGLSFSITPASGGANLTFSIASTWKKFGSHNNYAVSMGENCYSGGQHSFALGSNAYVEGLRNFAYGDNVKIDNDNAGHNVMFGKDSEVRLGTIYSTSFGNLNILHSAHHALVNGYDNSAIAAYSTILGESNSSTNTHNVAVGKSNFVGGTYAVGIGYDNTSNGTAAAAIGSSLTASGNYSFTGGYNNTVAGDYSTAFGQNNSVPQDNSFAVGTSNLVDGISSIASGNANTVTGSSCLAVGASNSISQSYGVAIGELNEIDAIGSTAIGVNNDLDGQRSIALGKDNTVSGNDSFVLGTNNVVTENNNVVLGTAKSTIPLASSLDPRLEIATGTAGGTGTGAQTVNISGVGSGYPPSGTYSTAVTSGGAGAGLQVEIIANFSTGAIISAGVVSAGSGYSVGDVIAITNAPQGSGGILTVASLGDNSYTSLSVAVPHGTGTGNSPHAASGLVFTALKDSPS